MLGLAAGIGLVVTVSGVAEAESKVLGALYRAGADVPPPGGNPSDVYIPPSQNQSMPVIDGNLHNDENTIYLTTADAPEVSREIAAGRRRSAR
jgi:hypothetical protein